MFSSNLNNNNNIKSSGRKILRTLKGSLIHGCLTTNICLVPRRLSFDENVGQRKAGRRQWVRRLSPAVCTLPMVPCGSSPVTRFALASAVRKKKRLRRRLH